MISVFDLFTIGIGPSSSHTVGPMKAANMFAEQLLPQLSEVSRITVEVYGSLAYSGKGHGTDRAVVLGLQGEEPEVVEPEKAQNILNEISVAKKLSLAKRHSIRFILEQDLLFNYKEQLPYHPNALRFIAYDRQSQKLTEQVYYSIGGGFVVTEQMAKSTEVSDKQVPYDFASAHELLEQCGKSRLSIAELVLANESSWQQQQIIQQQIMQIWQVMDESIVRGCAKEGILPGGLKVKRRAKAMYDKMVNMSREDTNWLNVYAIAVNEENAAGNRVVTAPTNGSAGVIPAVLKFYQNAYGDTTDNAIMQFMLTAGAIGILYKKMASISAAEMGCQGEIGVASSMAAGALTAVLGGSIHQIEKAAEIAIEHHLGLTCDPIAGLVQIPCIERNAMGAVKAVNAAKIALLEDAEHKVSLDQAIITMRQTGKDMSSKYRETSQGGLAVNVPEC